MAKKIPSDQLLQVLKNLADKNEDNYYVSLSDLHTGKMELSEAVDRAKVIAEKYGEIACVHYGDTDNPQHVGDAFPSGEYVETEEHIDTPPAHIAESANTLLAG